MAQYDLSRADLVFEGDVIFVAAAEDPARHGVEVRVRPTRTFKGAVSDLVTLLVPLGGLEGVPMPKQGEHVALALDRHPLYGTYVYHSDNSFFVRERDETGREIVVGGYRRRLHELGCVSSMKADDLLPDRTWEDQARGPASTEFDPAYADLLQTWEEAMRELERCVSTEVGR